MATTASHAPSKNGHASPTRCASPQPRMGQSAPELQRFGTLRQLPIALAAEHVVEAPLVQA